MEEVVSPPARLRDRLGWWAFGQARRLHRKLYELSPWYPFSLYPPIAYRLRMWLEAARYRSWRRSKGRLVPPFELEAAALGPEAPRLSVVTLVYDTPRRFFRRLVRSMLAQDYGGFEWVIVDNGSKKRASKAMLDDALARCPFARVASVPENIGIARATALAVSEARNEWLVFVDSDDVLSQDALSSVARVAAHRPHVRFIYSDMDYMDERDLRFGPTPKPECSHELVIGTCYTCHLHAMTRSLFEEAKLDSRLDFSTDWPIMVRAFAAPETVYHIPKILYSWRKHGDAVSALLTVPEPQLTTEQAAHVRRIKESQRAAVDSYLVARGLTDAYAAEEVWPGFYYVRYTGPREPPVTAVVFGGAPAGLRLRAATRYAAEALAIRTPEAATGRAAAIAAGAGAGGDYVAVLEEGVEPESPDWLREAVGLLERERGVGLVGGKIVTPDRSIAHAGLTTGGRDGGAPVRWLQRGEPELARRRWQVRREVWAIGGGAWVARADSLRKVGAPEAQGFGRTLDAADLSLRLRRAGYRVIYDPQIVFLETAPAPEPAEDEWRRFAERHAAELRFDPYYGYFLAED